MVMRAVRGGGAGGLGSSGAGQDGTRMPCAPCRSFPGIIKYFLRPGRRCNHIWICDSRALACWLVILGLSRSHWDPSSFTEELRWSPSVGRGERDFLQAPWPNALSAASATWNRGRYGTAAPLLGALPTPELSVPILAARDCSAIDCEACWCREAFDVASSTFGDGVSIYYHSLAQRYEDLPLLPVSQVHPRTPAGAAGTSFCR